MLREQLAVRADARAARHVPALLRDHDAEAQAQVLGGNLARVLGLVMNVHKASASLRLLAQVAAVLVWVNMLPSWSTEQLATV